ncbi:MAG TPA: polysaccharide deacetylase family protein [Desulfobacteraceae bacterium]|nr:polysaccharide deacetylase family protein [Desulfobacteraceae bacterium]
MPKISILMYHQVGIFPRPDEHRAIYCHIRRFKAQMAYLHLFGYKVLSLRTALDGLFGNGELPHHGVVLTFDDGYQNFSNYALPILKRYNFPATVFLVADLIGRNAKWLEEDGRYGAPLMDKKTVLELRRHNVTFGSHSLTHPFLTLIDRERQKQEIGGSKSALEDLLGEGVKYFCYPSGDYNEAVVDLVKDAGYEAALTCDRGAATPLDNPLALPRKAISFGDSLIGYFWKLHMKHKRKLQPAKQG